MKKFSACFDGRSEQKMKLRETRLLNRNDNEMDATELITLMEPKNCSSISSEAAEYISINNINNKKCELSHI